MIYDGFDFSGLLKVEAVRRPLAPSVAVSTVDVPGVPGAVFRGVAIEQTPIEVDVRIIAGRGTADDRKVGFEMKRREIAARLVRESPCPLVLPDAPDLTSMAVLSGSTDLDRFLHTGGTTLLFSRPDPIDYGAERSESCDGGELSVWVDGTWRTYPVLEVDTSDGNVFVEFDGAPFSAFGGSKGTVVVDAREPAARQDGTTLITNITEDFPTWEPGPHTVSCDDPFTVRWTERWL